MKSVLIIGHKSPFPILDGGCFAMSRLLNDVVSIPDCQVHYFVLSTQKHPFHLDSVPQIYRGVNWCFGTINTTLNPFSALSHVIRGKSYNLSRFYYKEIESELIEIISSNNIPTVIFDSVFSAVYAKAISKLTRAKLILRSHNVEFEIWKNLRDTAKNPWKRWYLNQLYLQLKNEEPILWKKMDAILSLSEEDSLEMEKYLGKKPMFFPVSLPVANQKLDFESNDLCFLGAFNWEPNLEAIHWFLNSVWPNLKKRQPGIKLNIAGLETNKIQLSESSEGINIHGFVKDVGDFLRSNGIFIAPLQSGSGVKIKVLEAMNVGLPVVLTVKGADGIPWKNELTLCDSPQDFEDEIIRLVESASERSKIAKLNSEKVRQFFVADVNSQLLSKLIQ